MPVQIFHNPRCSKSRATLQLLEDHQVQAEIIPYLERHFTANELRTLMQQLGITDPRQMMRVKDDLYHELGLDRLDPTVPAEHDQLLHAITAHSALLERPIVIHGNHARIGRPPEAVLEILG